MTIVSQELTTGPGPGVVMEETAVVSQECPQLRRREPTDD